MPALDCLENIRQCLGAASVSLPSASDFSSKARKRTAVKSGLSRKFSVPKKQKREVKASALSCKISWKRNRKAITKAPKWPSYFTKTLPNHPNQLWHESGVFETIPGLLESFFELSEPSVPNREAYVVRTFLRATNPTWPKSEAQVCLENHLVTSHQNATISMTPLELQELVSGKNVDGSEPTLHSGRRIM